MTFKDHIESFLLFSIPTFKNATSISSINKLKEEIKEAEFALLNPDKFSKEYLTEEYADMLMCIFDSAKRAGVTPNMIIKSFGEKVVKNINRKWIENPDHTYSHIKE